MRRLSSVLDRSGRASPILEILVRMSTALTKWCGHAKLVGGSHLAKGRAIAAFTERVKVQSRKPRHKINQPVPACNTVPLIVLRLQQALRAIPNASTVPGGVYESSTPK